MWPGFAIGNICWLQKRSGIDLLVHQSQKLQYLKMQCEQSWQPYNANMRDCTDEIDFKVEQVCHELILSDIRVMNQAANLHLIARAELFVETEMQDSAVKRSAVERNAGAILGCFANSHLIICSMGRWPGNFLEMYH